MLRLLLVLKAREGVEGLRLHGPTLAVTRLEWLSGGVLVHLEIAHILGVRIQHGRRWLVVLRLTPIALKVARRLSTMALAATTLDVALGSGVVRGRLGRRELEADRTPSGACAHATTIAVDSHALASTVSAAGREGTARCGVGKGRSGLLGARADGAVGGGGRSATSIGNGELEATSLPFGLRKLGGFLCLGQRKRMSASVSASGTAGGAASATAWGVVLVPLAGRKIHVTESRTRCTGRWSGRRTHAHVGQGGLVAAVVRRRGHATIHWNTKMLLPWWILKCVRLWREVHDLHLALQLLELGRQLLLLGDHAHVDILLVSGGDLLLLLLEHFDLLGEGELFHCEGK